jgi:hypothetical protein
MEQWHARRAVLAKRKRDMRNMRRMLWGGGVLMMLVAISDCHRGVFAVVGMATPSGVSIGLFFLVVRFIERDQQQQLAALESQIPEQ